MNPELSRTVSRHGAGLEAAGVGTETVRCAAEIGLPSDGSTNEISWPLAPDTMHIATILHVGIDTQSHAAPDCQIRVDV